LKAIDLGVTTLEMDLGISKDRKVIVSHDLISVKILPQPLKAKQLQKRRQQNCFCLI
jgi:glycerophosphoryl diester phosphodiesterase